MARITQETRMELDQRELARLCAGGTQTLVCERGELWITFDGSREDVILGAGESLELDARPDTVISALRPATLTLVPRQPRGVACLLAPGQAAWAIVRRLRWNFPALAALPATQLR